MTERLADDAPADKGTPPMSVEEVHRIARSEGLELLRSHVGTTGFRGVIDYKGSQTHPFIARIKVQGKHQHLGLFRTAAEGALAYARKVGGEACKVSAEKNRIREPVYGGATPTSLEDARRLAEAEGLLLVTRDGARSGYAGVVYHPYKPPAVKKEAKLVDSSGDEAGAHAFCERGSDSYAWSTDSVGTSRCVRPCIVSPSPERIAQAQAMNSESTDGFSVS